ncbi:hypothetical protein [Paraburkholderia sp. Cpub6]|uniref:hypothetical protein n=1 Tax=Paraburkholderia sp. Cpub6 TaxID=2723094 RepID=UPI00160EE5A6|nr:hypothetical protein [Paraburkholderia sp. Cpub6]MBB5456898.1 hypothetical protein [Paraburkholderia sp. Cpub6]
MMPSLEERVAARLARLENWCRDNGVMVSPAGEVCERDAARLLGYHSPKALRRQAIEGRLSPVLRRRRCGPRWLYTLDSIAEHIERELDRYAVS